MNVNKGLLTTIGIAALMVIGVACGDGDSTPTTAPTAIAALTLISTPTVPSPPTPHPAVQPDLVFGQELRSEKRRVTSPDLASLDMRDLVAGNSAFAFDLYQALSAEGGKLFYSPYSISLALAMTYAGAWGETEQQMANALHFVISQDRLHPAFKGLDLELAGRGEGAEDTDEEGFRLNIVNALWGQEDFEFLAEFLDLVAENYGAGPRLLDFVNAAKDSRIVIND